MKITTTMLVAVFIACFALALKMEAGVTWLASDDGTDLTLMTDGGSFNAGATSTAGTAAIGPEPSSMVMVSLSLAILMLRRRQGS